jgi:hypothetical protein
MSETLENNLLEFLLKDKTEEEACFVLWYPAKGSKRFNVLLKEMILPSEDERVKHGNISILPNFFDRAKEYVRSKRGGLALIHTHPLSVGWQDLSGPDLHYERDVMAQEVFGVTGLPLVGLTLSGNQAWSARIYRRRAKKRPVLSWCISVRVVGKQLKTYYNPKLKPKQCPSDEMLRTTSVWGDDIQSDLMRMRVGIIGAGSVGSAVVEILSRMGIGEIYVMDYDKVEIHNLDRLVSAKQSDAKYSRSKSKIACRNAYKAKTNPDFRCKPHVLSIVEEDGYRVALNCDVLFSCVDRPWPRQVLNHISYASLIPVINGGVSFKTDHGRLIHGVFRAETVGPERVCMNCLGSYDAGEIQLDREGKLDDPQYISELKKTGQEPSRQNIMPFSISLAGLESIQFVELVTRIGRKGDLGQQTYDYYSGEILPVYKECHPECEYSKTVAEGDANMPYLADDPHIDK